MSDRPTIAVSSTPRDSAVRASIARASQATGIDFSYLLAQAKMESGLDPSARATTSGAAGLYQFTRSTWLRTLDRHGADHGLGEAAAAIAGGRVSDPSTRMQLLAMRYDPDAASMMAAELASDNRADLTAVLGREPDAAELYLGHFLGIGGASSFLTALQTDPSQTAAALLPQAAGANRSIFYGPQGARSVGAVMDVIRSRMGAAMESGAQDGMAGDGAPLAAPGFETAMAPPTGGPIAQAFHAAQAELPQVAARPMSETLSASFGAAAPASVRDAYAKLARFGL